MKKIFLGVAFLAMSNWAFSQCNGVVLKEGNTSFKKFTDGMQVSFDFCGDKDQLVSILDKADTMKENAYLTVENDPLNGEKYNCVLTIRGAVDYDYAVKMMAAMGINKVTKNGQLLDLNNTNAWYK
ncbi:MAG: hypothetical protein RL609_566 [Bacteroidota bacterium]|jgi:hypothetical protein